jgi:cell division protein ZipA
MNELRWILIGFGIVLLAGIYLWGRRGGGVAPPDRVGRARPEPSFTPPRESLPGRSDHAGADAEHEPASARVDEFMTTAIRAARPSASGPRTSSPEVAPAQVDSRRSRMEPTLGDTATTEELPVRAERTSPVSGTAHATPEPTDQTPTLSSSESPQPRRIERRKILSLRLAASPQRFDGAKLLEALEAEALQYGKYSVFHRMHADGVSVFSVASMVEPGTFEPEKMPDMQYTGITLFAQLPGPVPGMHALNELVACARRLQQSLGGTLQDDRGVPLTVHRIERLRQEVREFERPPSASGSRGTPTAPPVSS